MRRLTASFVAASLALWLTGCGGGGSLGGGSTPSPTITSVSVTASPTTITTAQTATCTATVAGTGSFSSSVTWTATKGTITSSGVLTPSGTGTTTCTATSTQDQTKSSGASITVTAPAVSVIISPTSATVPSGGTQQFTATVVNATDTSVTWSTTAGTISTSGLLSLAGVAAGTNVTVTVTSNADSTKSATAQVTITQRQITIALSPSTANSRLLTPMFPIGVGNPSPSNTLVADDLSATGIQAGDIATTTDPSGSVGVYTVTAADVANGYFLWPYAFNCTDTNGCHPTSVVLTTTYAPHFIKAQVASADGTIKSNTLWIPFTTDQQTMVFSKDGSSIYFALSSYPVQKYATADGASQGTVMGENNLSIAVDDQTGDLITNESTTEGSLTGTIYATSILGNSANANTITIAHSAISILMAVAAKSGVGYATDTAAGTLDQIDLSQMAVIDSVPSGIDPWAMDVATVKNTDLIATYSVQDTTLRYFDKNLDLISSLPLTGVTGDTGKDFTGGWPLKLFASGTVALLSSYDKLLITASLDTTNTLQLAKQISLAGNPIGLAKDEAHQAIIVWYANTATGVTTVQSFDLATLTPKTIDASSLPVGFEASGILVSSDGTKLYVGGINFTDDAVHGFKANQPSLYILKNQ